MPKQSELQLQELSALVHSVLAALHLLGACYNLKRSNHWDVLAHSVAAAYDIHAVHIHLRDISLLKEQR